LGGHSLLAAQVVTRVRQQLGLDLMIRDVFEHPVLADLARVLENTTRATLPAITRAERDDRVPLSYAQQRLWFLAQLVGGSEAYRSPFAVRLHGDLDRAALGKALDRIVERHEALRTIFVSVDGEPVQRIIGVEGGRFDLVEHDLREGSDRKKELGRLMEEESRASFDLEIGPLVRGRLIRESERQHGLLVTMHDIVTDGWSMGVLMEELSVLYGAFVSGETDPLPELPVQYADYAVWQRRWMEGEVLRQQSEYWKNTLIGAPGLLELPADHARPAQQDF